MRWQCCPYIDWHIEIQRNVFARFYCYINFDWRISTHIDCSSYRSCSLCCGSKNSSTNGEMVRKYVRSKTVFRQSVILLLHCLWRKNEIETFLFREDDPFQGFTVRVGDRGMRLFASEYWKCSETACVNDASSSLKFVFSESLLKNNTGEDRSLCNIDAYCSDVRIQRWQRSNHDIYSAAQQSSWYSTCRIDMSRWYQRCCKSD